MNTPIAVARQGSAAATTLFIARQISQGELRAGDRLPSERAMAEQFKISRPSVRRVVQTLVDAGLVNVESGKGPASGAYVVSTLVPVELLDPTRTLPTFREVERVLEARRLFEPAVALFASTRLDDRDYESLNQVINLQKQANDLQGIRSLDLRFHLAIADATHNSVIRRQMEHLMREVEIARHVVTVDHVKEAKDTIEMHERTLEVIASGDDKKILETMDEHLQMMEHAWEELAERKLSHQSPRVLYGLEGNGSL